MRFGAKGGQLAPAVFNMSRTDLAGIALFAFVAVFIVIFIKIMSE